ncbi:unnamed protein product [Arabis nemorensis]|uniref:DYW domain-containing protein n=1 Tax=Arabis nemorensis TaxID=586526 RepID=A0A565B0R2_9BRAS|nr:unnamed protein product [Arabis nemorensis]
MDLIAQSSCVCHHGSSVIVSGIPTPIVPSRDVEPHHRPHRSFKDRAPAKSLARPSRTRQPFNFPTKNPKPFRERDAFPSSLPLHSKNPYSIHRDIQKFARQNNLEDALMILDYLEHRGIHVNATTFSALLAACVRRKSLFHGKQVHVHIRINGLENNEFIRTKLVHMYTACGLVMDAHKVFDESTSSNVYSWNALLRGTVISGKRKYQDVLSTITEMREQGVDLNVFSFSNVFKSFAGASAFCQVRATKNQMKLTKLMIFVKLVVLLFIVILLKIRI